MGLRKRHEGLGQPDLGVNRRSETCVPLEASGCPRSWHMDVTRPRARLRGRDAQAPSAQEAPKKRRIPLFRPARGNLCPAGWRAGSICPQNLQGKERPPCTQHTFKKEFESHKKTQPHPAKLPNVVGVMKQTKGKVQFLFLASEHANVKFSGKDIIAAEFRVCIRNGPTEPSLSPAT